MGDMYTHLARDASQELTSKAPKVGKLWSARTCPRFESGDMSPQSKKKSVGQKSSGTSSRSVLMFLTVATNAGGALRANHAAEHHV